MRTRRHEPIARDESAAGLADAGDSLPNPASSLRGPLTLVLATFLAGLWLGYRFGTTGHLGSDLLLVGVFALLVSLLAVWAVTGILSGPTRLVKEFGWTALGSYGILFWGLVLGVRISMF